MRPIAILGFCVLLGWLVYSQRHMFIQGLVKEVQKEIGASPVDTAVVNSGPSVRELLSEGQALFEAENLEQAEGVFLKAIAIDSQSAESYAHLGLIRSVQKKYDGALVFWLQAVEHAPGNTGYRINLGRAYAQVGKTDDALAQWKAVLEKDPYHQTAKELIAKVSGE